MILTQAEIIKITIVRQEYSLLFMVSNRPLLNYLNLWRDGCRN